MVNLGEDHRRRGAAGDLHLNSPFSPLGHSAALECGRALIAQCCLMCVDAAFVYVHGPGTFQDYPKKYLPTTITHLYGGLSKISTLFFSVTPMLKRHMNLRPILRLSHRNAYKHRAARIRPPMHSDTADFLPRQRGA